MSDINRKVYSYFKKNYFGNYWECTLCLGDANESMDNDINDGNDTRGTLKGGLWNLKQHLSRIHKREAFELSLPPPTKKRCMNDQNCKTITIEANLNTIMREIVKFFLETNQPLANADNFGKIECIKKSLQAFGITLDRHLMRKYIMSASEQIYSLISDEIKDIFPGLIFNAHRKNLYSVSIRYLKEDAIVERAIGMLTRYNRQSSTIQASELMELLEKIDKGFEDIYATCCDSEQNMLENREILFTALRHAVIYNEFAVENCLDIIDLDDLCTDYTTDEDRSTTNENGMISLNDNLSPFCSTIACAVNLLESCAKDVTKLFEDCYLKEIRKFVIESKKDCHNEHFNNDVTRPVLDNVNSWASTYLMIANFHSYKEHYQNFSSNKLKLSSKVWMFIEEFRECFENVHQTMKEFQSTRISLTDMIIKWRLLEITTSRLENGDFLLPVKLLKSLKERSQKYYECDAVAAAAVLDPRITFSPSHDILNITFRDKGVAHLEKIYEKIDSPASETKDMSLENGTTKSNYEDLMNEYVFGKILHKSPSITKNIHEILLYYFDKKDLSMCNAQLDIYKYWSSKKYDPSLNKLYKISQVVFGAPATHAIEIDQTTNSFALVYSHLETTASRTLLDSLYVTKMNLDLIHKVNFFSEEY